MEKDKCKIATRKFSSRNEMGRAAAKAVGDRIRSLLNKKDYVNIIFAAAPSQNEFLESLILEDIDWQRVNAFHMDEYIGLKKDASQRFGNFLKARIFEKVPFNSVYYIDGSAKDTAAECLRYSDLLKKFPTDIVCLGIGENGHLAFNDPPVANFEDGEMVKLVKLDIVCRQQQVNDGCFDSLFQVPKTALTLTIPALMMATHIYGVIPAESKAGAVYNTFFRDIDTLHPSTILRQHNSVSLFLDDDSSSLLPEDFFWA